MKKISAVYKIVNTITSDSYVGSSKDLIRRWAEHKYPSKWKKYPNNPMYQDMQKYGLKNFRFQILAPIMPEYLKQVEQEFIEMIKPIYNNRMADGQNVERRKKGKKKWRQSEKGKRTHRKTIYKYFSQLCLYKGETLTLNALNKRFRRAGIKDAILEAKKYLLKK